MSLLKKLASQTAVYGLSSVLGRTLNYLLVPLYTSVFAPGEYGIVTELYAYVAFLNILYIYGLETAYFRFVSKPGTQNAFNISFTSILITSIVFSGIIYVVSDEIASVLQYPEKGDFIRWMALILGIDAIVTIPFARLRQEGKATSFAFFKLSNISLNIGLNLFFLVFCPWILSDNPDHFLSAVYNPNLGVGYVLLSNLIANAVYILFFIPTWIKVRLTFDSAEWRKMMRYAWPILIIGFAGVTNEMLSRAILKYRLPEGFYAALSNIEILGIFGACYKLSIFMTLAVQAFRYAFEPFFFAKATDKNSPELFSKIMTWFVIFTSFSWLVITAFLPWIGPVFLRQDSYLQALSAVPWLLGGGLFLGIFYNLSLWYKLTDKTKYGAVISVIGAAITLILNWILIPRFGYMGSAYATFASYSSMVIVSYVWGKTHYPVPYNLGKISTYLGLAILGIVINGQFQESILSATLIVLIFLTLAILFERRTFLSQKVNS
ncbi:MAG: polysaccharide biosynthesis C-terminal domain-containing protein [Cyclobacteriaceae bacterium]